MERRRRANLGGNGRTAVEGKVRRRTRRTRNEPAVAEDVASPIGRYVRNIPISDPYRYGDYTHASDLVYKCMRMVALADDLSMPVPTEPNWQSMKLIHEMGHASAAYVTRNVLAQSDAVFGYWKCICGDLRLGPFRKSEISEHDESCENCNQHVSVYDELTFKNEEYKIVGNCDLAFMDDQGFLMLSELKSISKTQFVDLGDAKPDHKLQLFLYYQLATLAGYQLHPSLSVFYSCREWMIGNPFKEFLLDADTAERRTEPLLREAMAIQQWRSNQIVPERTLCNRPQDARAKKCGMCAECFGRD